MTGQIGYFELIGFGEHGWGFLLLKAMFMTIAIASSGFVFGAFFGAIIAYTKLSASRILRYIGDCYTTVFRGVPDLLVIYLIYFGGSSIVTKFSSLFGVHEFVSLPVFLSGCLAVGIISGAYQTEIYRGAFLAISKGQLDAAKAAGMHNMLMFRRIILPQLFRLVLPALGNIWQMVLKESALVSLIGVTELVWQAQVAAGSTRKPFYFYITAALLYLVITGISGFVFQKFEHRANHYIRKSS